MRYTRDAGPGDTGVRVSLRRRLAEGGLGDLLGVVERWVDGEVRVRDRHGVVHVVDESDVVAAKRVPPAPERR
ncbi:MAG TPA: ferrous iron transport protein A [Mycobacteriales bacterium]|nr:ferrous iron transport protein A [Mycobacteriales bacterium]